METHTHTQFGQHSFGGKVAELQGVNRLAVSHPWAPIYCSQKAQKIDNIGRMGSVHEMACVRTLIVNTGPLDICVFDMYECTVC